MALVAVAEVGDRVFRPLIGLGQQHAVFPVGVDVSAQRLQELMRAGQVFAVGSLLFVEVRDGVEAHAVDAHFEPEVERLEHLGADARVLEVEVRLV